MGGPGSLFASFCKFCTLFLHCFFLHSQAPSGIHCFFFASFCLLSARLLSQAFLKFQGQDPGGRGSFLCSFLHHLLCLLHSFSALLFAHSAVPSGGNCLLSLLIFASQAHKFSCFFDPLKSPRSCTFTSDLKKALGTKQIRHTSEHF